VDTSQQGRIAVTVRLLPSGEQTAQQITDPAAGMYFVSSSSVGQLA
jgi:hypothetical protein